MKKDREDAGANDATPPPPPPQSTTPALQHKRLAILSAYIEDALTEDWLFLTADLDQGVGCREDWVSPVQTRSILGGTAGPTYPGGTFDVDLGIDGPKCQYKNDGHTAGRVWCGDRQIACNSVEEDSYQCSQFLRTPRFTCPY